MGLRVYLSGISVYHSTEQIWQKQKLFMVTYKKIKKSDSFRFKQYRYNDRLDITMSNDSA